MEYAKITLAEYEKLVDTAERVKILFEMMEISDTALTSKEELAALFGMANDE